MAEIQKEVLFKIGYGVYIVSASADGKDNGQIANVVFQVTAEPAKIAICINKDNLTYEIIKKSGFFGVSIIEEETPMTFIGTFGFKSGRDIDKYEKIDFKRTENGVPLVKDFSVGIMEMKVVGELDSGSHTLFVGELISSEVLKDSPPMTYAYYHEVKKGKSPKTAPTFVGNM